MARQASFFTFPNDRLQNYLNQYFPVNLHKKGRVIPHILALKDVPEEYKQSPGLVLQHSGRLWYPRDPGPFLQAVKALIDEHGISSEEFKLEFIGTQDVGLHTMISELEISSYVTISQAVSYTESLRHMERISFGLVIEADMKEGIFFPSKVADYFQMRKPVLAISPAQGVLHDLSLKEKAVVHTNNRDVKAITAVLLAIYKAWKSDPALKAFAVSHELQQKYSDEKAVHNYQDLFMRILKQNT
jgi:hypothetical protein